MYMYCNDPKYSNIKIGTNSCKALSIFSRHYSKSQIFMSITAMGRLLHFNICVTCYIKFVEMCVFNNTYQQMNWYQVIPWCTVTKSLKYEIQIDSSMVTDVHQNHNGCLD